MKILRDDELNLFGRNVYKHLEDNGIFVTDLPEMTGLSQGTINNTFRYVKPSYKNVITIINCLQLETNEYLQYAGLM